MILVKKERSELEKEAARLIAKSIMEVSARKDNVVIALCGGRSVGGIFGALKLEDVDWSMVHIFMVDERLVPIDDPDSNFSLMNDRLLSDLVECGKLSPSHIHPFIYSGKVSQDLEYYESELREISSSFDIALLSAGEDGHVAGLFPNHPTVKSEEEYFISTNDSPKPPKGRMSSSRRLLARTDTAFVLFIGEAKREALEKFNDDKYTMGDCPAKVVKLCKNSYILTDLG
jgi:6-phosphogluconolactonase